MTEGSAKPELRHGGVSEERVAREARGWLVMVHWYVRLDAMSVRYACCFDAYFHAYVRSYFHGLYMSLLCEILDHPFSVLFRVLRGAFLFWNDFTATTLEMDLSTVQYMISSCTCVRLFNPSMWISWPLPLENQVCEQKGESQCIHWSRSKLGTVLSKNILLSTCLDCRFTQSGWFHQSPEEKQKKICRQPNAQWREIVTFCPAAGRACFLCMSFWGKQRDQSQARLGLISLKILGPAWQKTVSMLKVSLTTLLFRLLQRS